MAWQDFFKTYMIAIIVGGVLLVIIVILLLFVCSLFKKLQRLEYNLKIIRSDKQIVMNPAEFNRLERQQTMRKYKSSRTVAESKKRSPKHELETHEEDYTQRKTRYDSEDDEEAQFVSEGRGADRVNFYKENPLSPWNRSQNQQIAQIYRSHMNRYPSQKPNSSMQASSRMMNYQVSNDGEESPVEEEDETLDETIDQQNQAMENSIEDSIHESELEEMPSLTPPKPIRMASQNYKLTANQDDEGSEDAYRLTESLRGTAYFQSFLSSSDLENLVVHLQSMSLTELQQSVQALIEKNNQYRSKSKLPPRMTSARIQEALVCKETRDAQDQLSKETSTASSLLQRYSQMLTAENDKFHRRLTNASIR
jgi:hypothetical protein